MKTHILYAMIGVLLAGNIALLLKKTPLPSVSPQKAAQHDLVTVVAKFEPRLVKMAPAGERPED